MATMAGAARGTGGRGAKLAPQTPLQAWAAFLRELGVIVGGLLVVASIHVLSGALGLSLRVTQEMDLFWLTVLLVVALPFVLVYEIWVLRDRLRAFRRGEIHLEEGERATPAARRPRGGKAGRARELRRTFWRRVALFGALWLFCALAAAALIWIETGAGRPADPKILSAIPAFIIVLIAMVVMERAELAERLRMLEGG
ncbi:MAG: hypothetical protein JJT81_01265 [Rubellimicrobium sp.]|nr:hypothetical protein [Rubellimicrobium sp.]